jgi:hypothetical protein
MDWRRSGRPGQVFEVVIAVSLAAIGGEANHFIIFYYVTSIFWLQKQSEWIKRTLLPAQNH